MISPATTPEALAPSPPGSAPRPRYRVHPGRLARILVTFSRHGILLARDLVFAAQAPAPRRVRRAFEDLGPTFIKLGQIVASSPGLFPVAYSDEFQKCLDRVPAFPFERVRRILEQDLGAAPEKLFRRIDPRPVASASVAQVHFGETLDGIPVAIKVQRPSIRRLVEQDLGILYRLAGGVERSFRLARLANPVGIVRDFDRTIHEELDFRLEAESMERFRAIFAEHPEHRVRIAAFHPALSSRRVLTMERLEGIRVHDPGAVAAAGIDGFGCLRESVKAFLRTLMLHGLFHGDVHGGNFFFSPANEVVLMDFGIVGRMTTEQTRNVTRLILALVTKDFRGVTRALLALGSAPPDADLERIAAELESFVPKLLATPLREIALGEVLTRVVELAVRNGIQLPREMVLVVKQIAYFDRYAHALAPTWNVMQDPYLIDFLVKEERGRALYPEFAGLLSGPAGANLGGAEAVLFNPFLPEVRADPYPHYRRLRSEDPLHWNPLGFWLLSRYGDGEAVLRDRRFAMIDPRDRQEAALFGVDPEALGSLQAAMAKTMLFTNPPDHTRLRGLVAKAFTPRMIEGLRENIESIVAELLGAARAAGVMDLIADFAYPLPVIVIAEMIGVPAEDRPKFRRWSRDLAATIDPIIMPEAIARAGRAMGEFAEYFRALIARRRSDPRADLLSAMIAAEEAGDRLSEEELVANLVLLLSAGHETTMNLIGNGTFALLRHPAELGRLREDPSLAASAVEEMLRYDSPVQMTGRKAVQAVELGRGKTVEPGQRVIVLIGAANRDPDRFTDPDHLDVGRRDNEHLAFGGGIHFCLGAALARAEAQAAIRALARAFPALRLQADSPAWRETITLRGLKELSVSF